MAFIPTHSEKRFVERPPLCQAPSIDWSHFLCRSLSPPPQLDWNELVSGKKILITGAGGSIGSALALLLMSGLPRSLILLDRSERHLHDLYKRYRERQSTLPEVVFVPGDILDSAGLEEIFCKYQPDTVFHAAALKHLVQLESKPLAALETNLVGTLKLLEIMDCFPVETFVNVSTDKAVNPTSILGVSKRLVELFLLAGDSTGSTRLSLRLGNVLESSRSAVPIFLQRLRQQCPVTITDPRACRYFLTLEETAAFLVRSLEIQEDSLLLPEMGATKSVLDLARFLARELQVGAPMIFTGLRDGEKRSEQLTYDYEFLENTQVTGISKVCGTGHLDPERFVDDLGRLLELVLERRKAGVLEALLALVPEFTPSATLLRSLS